MLWMNTKKGLTPIFRFFENFPGGNGRNRRGMKAVIDSFEIYTTNSLIKKKISKLILSCSELYFG